METMFLKFTLESDATFGRGDGVAGLVDDEVQHDEYGLPYLFGRTIKGLLAAEAGEITAALNLARWNDAARFLFGDKGSEFEAGALRVGDAQLPRDLRDGIARDFAPLWNEGPKEREREWGLKRAETLEALTALRRQTAMDYTGAPEDDTLRTMRVILRGTIFLAPLTFSHKPDDDAVAFLAACTKTFHRAGSGRNRGRGRLNPQLLDEKDQEVTERYFKILREAVPL